MLHSIIKVGGNSSYERQDRMLRIEDCKNSAISAIDSGFVTGGALTLLRLSHCISTIDTGIRSFSGYAGYASLSGSFVETCDVLASSSGLSSYIVKRILFGSNKTLGFNAKRNTFCECITAGIFDPSRSLHGVVSASSRITCISLSVNSILKSF